MVLKNAHKRALEDLRSWGRKQTSHLWNPATEEAKTVKEDKQNEKVKAIRGVVGLENL